MKNGLLDAMGRVSARGAVGGLLVAWLAAPGSASAETTAIAAAVSSTVAASAGETTAPVAPAGPAVSASPATTATVSAPAAASGETLTTGTAAAADGAATSTTATAREDGMTTSTLDEQWINGSGAAWVWPAAVGDKPNQYVQIIHEVELPAGTTDSVSMAISADTNYIVWMNGKLAGTGQWSDYPDDKTFDELDLKTFARPGSNRICMLIWYQGESTSQYLKGEPGVVYAVRAGGRIAAVSGPETLMRQAPDYVSGPLPRVTPQLSFTFEHHGNKYDGWMGDDYEAGEEWTRPGPEERKGLSLRPVRPRPVPKLVLAKRIPMRVAAQGVFTRTDPSATPAVAMQSDALAFRSAAEMFKTPRRELTGTTGTALEIRPEVWRNMTGAYVLMDAGREEAGLMELVIDAPEGTVVDIGYGEHLEDLRVRTSVGGRNFANRYICGSGRLTFLHPFLRIAGRYVQVHIMPPSSAQGRPVSLYYAGLRPTDYPVKAQGSFRSSDSLQNQIWDVSSRTLLLCMHEHYEDCPWREQSLYAMDSRNQALAGYYCFGNYDFAAASIDLMGKGMKKDGFLELCAPAEVPITIPSFSVAWILMLDDYLLFTGDRKFVREQFPVARRILETCGQESSGPVVRTPVGRRMWNFYEWAPGLDGAVRLTGEDEQYDAPLNLFYLLALDAAARMARECGVEGEEEFRRRAKELREVFAGRFWDEEERAFRTRVGDTQERHFAELTQALAILAGVVPEEELADLRKRLADDNNGLVPCTLSHTLYKFEALLTDRERYASRVFELIARDWGYMLNQGATSFWETIEGASAFADAGSLCHGWSGIPAWFYSAYLLGVKPTSPGFAEYSADPIPGVVDSAEGNVPTPAGPIKVRWHTENGKIVKELTPPAATDK